jgi:basic membrane protein A
VALVEAGADVIAQHQDTPSSVQGAAEKGAWAIGSESDMMQFAPEKYLTGTIWNWCSFYVQAVQMVQDGTFGPGEFYGGLKDGTVSLAPINAAVPDDVRQMVEKKKQALIDDTFDYWKGPLEDNQGNQVVAAGDTLSIADINGMDWLVEGVVGKIP